MLKTVLPAGIWLCLVLPAPAQSRILPGLLKPYSLTVTENRLIVFEASDYSFRIFSLADLQPIGRFGRRGEGPGEFTGMPELTVLTDRLFVCGPRNAFWFTPEGELIRQQKTPPFVYFTPLADHYVGESISYREEERYSYYQVDLYDDSFTKVRNIYGQKKRKMITESPHTKQDLLMIDPFFGVRVSGDRLYIADTRKGFHIAVFDQQGNLHHEIRREPAGVPVTREYKKRVMERYKTSKLWLENKRNFNYIFPEFFPPIKSFTATAYHLYVWTHAQQENRYRLLVLDLDGKISKALYLPYHNSLQAFAGQRFYHLRDSVETWELVIRTLND